LIVPTQLPTVMTDHSVVVPFGYLATLDVRFRFAQRLALTTGLGYGNVGFDTTTVTVLPLDVNVRVDLVPIQGPVAFYLGAGARGAVNLMAVDSNQTASTFTVGAYPELAVEFTWLRRRALEVFARYDFGLVSTGAPAPLGALDPLNGVQLGIAAHGYF
jgi:hypothetical protein